MPLATPRKLAALVLIAAPLACVAQPTSFTRPQSFLGLGGPYYLGASQTFGYDSNIFRLPDRGQVTLPDGGVLTIEPESSGLISVTTLLAGFDQTISRQRLYGSLSAGYASYSNQTQLNNPTFALNAGWDWETLYNLSGTVALDAGQQLGDYSNRAFDSDQLVVVGDNNEQYYRASALFNFGDWRTSSVWFVAGIVAQNVQNEISYVRNVPRLVGTDPTTGLPVIRLSDGSQEDDRSTAYSVGVRYRTSPLLTLGAGVRTESRRKDFSIKFVDPGVSRLTQQDSRRNDIDLFANWSPSGASDLRARLSYGTLDYTTGSRDDTTEWTGDLVWDWQATGKTRSWLRVLYDREDRQFGGTSQADGSGTELTTAVQWQLNYQVTGKVAATFNADYYRRNYDQLGGFTDRDTNWTLALNWAALPSTTIGCSVGQARRRSTESVDIGRYSYLSNQASCYAQVVLR
jgi:hypothetical protein